MDFYDAFEGGDCGCDGGGGFGVLAREEVLDYAVFVVEDAVAVGDYRCREGFLSQGVGGPVVFLLGCEGFFELGRGWVARRLFY